MGQTQSGMETVLEYCEPQAFASRKCMESYDYNRYV